MTRPAGQKPNSLPLDEIYGNIQGITNIFYWFIALILFGLVASIFIVMSTHSIIAAIVIAISILPVLASLYFVRRQNFEFAATFLALVLITAITITATNGLGIHHISVFGYSTILIVASLVVRKPVMVILTLYNILCVAWLVFGELFGAYTPTVLVKSVAGDFFSTSLILVLTAVMVRLLSDTLFKSSLELKKELRERKLAEGQYRSIFENAIEGMFQSMFDGRFISVNPAMARMYGYDSPDEMVREVEDIASQLYVEPGLRLELRRRLLSGERVSAFESLDYRKDGSTFWTSMNVQASHDTDGNVLYYEGTVEDITQRKLADEALRESEERYRTLFNGILDGIYRSTHAGQFVDVNPAMVKMFGYASREELLAVDIPKELYFEPEDRKSFLLDANQERVDEFRMRRKDGSEIWVEDHGRYVQDENGEILFHEGILRDVTPRRIAELERKRAEETLIQFRKLMDESNDAIFLIDPETSQYIDFNRTAHQQLGYTRSELTKLGVINIAQHVQTPEGWHQRMELVQERDGLIFETVYKRKDGTTFPVEVSARMLDYGGQLILVGLVRNITERKAAQAALIASEKKYRQLFENMTSAFAIHKMVYDEMGNPSDYRYLEINPAFEKLTGLSSNVLLGKTLKEVMPNTEAYWIEVFGKVAMTGEPIAYTNFSRELGKHYDTYVFSPEKDIFAVVFNDVTEKVKAQEQVQQLNEELQERVRELEAKNTELEQFTYTVSHDLKAPIITIKGFLGFLEKDILEGKQDHVHKDVRRIDEAVDKMHRLLSELLELSRIGRMMNQPEMVPFNGLVQDALDNLRGRLEPRAITVLTQPNLPAVHGDRQRLTEVLQNLLDNAAKYMGDQTDPRIEVGQQGDENGRLIFFVRDNGIGIAPEYHERIFGLFNKLDARSEGTGIGLALVKRIIEVHGGRVWVESAEGKGSTFYFTLPVK